MTFWKLRHAKRLENLNKIIEIYIYELFELCQNSKLRLFPNLICLIYL